MKIIILLVILVIIAGGNIITYNVGIENTANDIYAYEEGSPLQVLGINDCFNLEKGGVLETRDIRHGDVIMKTAYSNSDDWNNSGFENYEDSILFFIKTKLFLFMLFVVVIFAGMVIAAEMLL